MIQGAPVFYDNWVARDINGTALENAPFEQVFHHTESNERFQQHLPVQGELHIQLLATGLSLDMIRHMRLVRAILTV
jgi:hypothetical protein